MGADPPARDAEEEPTGAPPSQPQVPDLQAKNDALRCSSARAPDDHRATVSTPQSTRAAQEREAARAKQVPRAAPAAAASLTVSSAVSAASAVIVFIIFLLGSLDDLLFHLTLSEWSC